MPNPPVEILVKYDANGYPTATCIEAYFDEEIMGARSEFILSTCEEVNERARTRTPVEEG